MRINTSARRAKNVAVVNSILYPSKRARTKDEKEKMARLEGNTCPVCLRGKDKLERLGSPEHGWVERAVCNRCKYALWLLGMSPAVCKRAAAALKGIGKD